MVKDLDTVVTNGAVAASRRPIELTSDTPMKLVFIESNAQRKKKTSTNHFIRTVIPLISTFR